MATKLPPKRSRAAAARDDAAFAKAMVEFGLALSRMDRRYAVRWLRTALDVLRGGVR